MVPVMGVVLAAAPVGPDSLLAQSRGFRSRGELVSLTVTMKDRAGRDVPDLTVADFAMFEEGKSQVVSRLRRGSRTTRRCV